MLTYQTTYQKYYQCPNGPPRVFRTDLQIPNLCVVSNKDAPPALADVPTPIESKKDLKVRTVIPYLKGIKTSYQEDYNQGKESKPRTKPVVEIDCFIDLPETSDNPYLVPRHAYRPNLLVPVACRPLIKPLLEQEPPLSQPIEEEYERINWEKDFEVSQELLSRISRSLQKGQKIIIMRKKLKAARL